MQKTQPSGIKALSILHIGLLTGQVIFALIIFIIAYLGKSQSTSSLKAYPTQLALLCIGVGAAAYLGGNVFFRKKLEQINGSAKTLSEKFNDYRAACITRWALAEFATLFCIILFFVSRINLLMVIIVALILIFFTTKPSLEKVASDLNVSAAEIEQMNAGSSC